VGIVDGALLGKLVLGVPLGKIVGISVGNGVGANVIGDGVMGSKVIGASVVMEVVMGASVSAPDESDSADTFCPGTYSIYIYYEQQPNEKMQAAQVVRCGMQPLFSEVRDPSNNEKNDDDTVITALLACSWAGTSLHVTLSK
jgi:hypothetical protein